MGKRQETACTIFEIFLLSVIEIKFSILNSISNYEEMTSSPEDV